MGYDLKDTDAHEYIDQVSYPSSSDGSETPGSKGGSESHDGSFPFLRRPVPPLVLALTRLTTCLLDWRHGGEKPCGCLHLIPDVLLFGRRSALRVRWRSIAGAIVPLPCLGADMTPSAGYGSAGVAAAVKCKPLSPVYQTMT